jgi:hypothetical protein
MKPKGIISVPQSPLMNSPHFWKKGSFEKGRALAPYLCKPGVSPGKAASQLSS